MSGHIVFKTTDANQVRYYQIWVNSSAVIMGKYSSYVTSTGDENKTRQYYFCLSGGLSKIIQRWFRRPRIDTYSQTPTVYQTQ